MATYERPDGSEWDVATKALSRLSVRPASLRPYVTEVDHVQHVHNIEKHVEACLGRVSPHLQFTDKEALANLALKGECTYFNI